MLALSLGLLLLLGGGSGRFGLISSRANTIIALVGAVVGLYGAARVIRWGTAASSPSEHPPRTT